MWGIMKNKLELWGGLEYTVNRVGDRYSDQCERTGHKSRLGDLELIAELGIKTLRYPILWESVAPDGIERANWQWTDERMGRLRELGIEPIVGLLHHGSGPRDTSLLDPEFSQKFAQFAYAVARRYPWVKKFTPINEPLTTARFSALYGFWYPHTNDQNSFLRALFNECRGIVEAMKAIRTIIADAELVQTEDMGKTFSTPLLDYQARFENERRWLSFDLLCGREPGRRVLNYMTKNGISSAEIDWFMSNGDKPAYIGINHYVTSERYLDERLHLFPEWSHGGNQIHRYADVHATRADIKIPGIRGILAEAWHRYQLPIAITETHLGDPVEEQKRWLWERWQVAAELRNQGADIRAVTVWALFGCFDWNSLLLRNDNFYEPGVFDISDGLPKRTPLYDLVHQLATSGCCSQMDTEEPGWWHRPDRVHWPIYDIDDLEKAS
jgi:dTDP-4-dehydrorhamnose reductase